MKRITLAVLVIAAAACLQASVHSLTGFITDTQNDPVAYAMIENTATGSITASDENGHFKLPVPSNSGDHLLIYRIGYTKQQVTITDSNPIHIVLEHDPVQMETISVEGKSTSPSLTANDYSSSRNQSSIYALADQIPAIQLRSYGGSLSANRSLSLNGGPSNHTKVFLDNVDLTSSQNGVTDLSQIPLPLLSDISVSPLPGVFYGSGAVDGVLTLRPKSHRTSLHLSAGSFGFQSIHAEIAGSKGSLSTHFSIGQTKERGNFTFEDGDTTLTRENSQFEQRWVYGAVSGAIRNRLFISSFGLLSIQDREIAGSINFPSPNAIKQDTLVIHAVSLGLPFNSGYCRMDVSRRTSGEEYKNRPMQSFHDLITDHGKLTLVYRPASFIRFQSLAEVKKEYIHSTDTGSHSRTIFSGSALAAFSFLNTIQFIPSYRFDLLMDSDYKQTFDFRTSVSLPFSSSLSFAGGTAFLYPGFNDLYYEDAWGSSGNPDLKPEESEFMTGEFKYDLGQNGFVSLSYTNRKSQDLIQWQPTDESGLVWSPVNIAKTRRKALTITGEIIPENYPLILKGHFSFNNLKDETTGKPLLHTPDKIGMLSLEYNFHSFSTRIHTHYTGERRYNETIYDENWVPNIVEKTMEGFFRVSMSAGYKLSVRQRQLSLHLTVNNLLDEDVRTFPDYPEPGRTVNFSVSHQFK